MNNCETKWVPISIAIGIVGIFMAMAIASFAPESQTQKEKDAIALYEMVEGVCAQEDNTLEFKTTELPNGNLGFYITCVAK